MAEKLVALDSLKTYNTQMKTVYINPVETVAKGANQAISFSNYSSMISSFNSASKDKYNVGQNVMIITLNVPDLWISAVNTSSTKYTYSSDANFINELNSSGQVKIGYYTVSPLETQKVDLSNYITTTKLTENNTTLENNIKKYIDTTLLGGSW